jgi:hypothetical protein
MSQRYVNSPLLKNSAVILMIKRFLRSLRRNEKNVAVAVRLGVTARRQSPQGFAHTKPSGSPSNQPFTS